MITAQSTTILNIKSYLSQHILASKKKHCQSTYDVGRKKRSSSIEKKLAIGRHPVMARHFVLSIKIWAGLAVQGWTQEFPVEYIVYTSIYTDYTQLTIQLTAAAYIVQGHSGAVSVYCAAFFSCFYSALSRFFVPFHAYHWPSRHSTQRNLGPQFWTPGTLRDPYFN